MSETQTERVANMVLKKIIRNGVSNSLALTNVEQNFLDIYPHHSRLAPRRIPSIVTHTKELMGKLTALRFLEWVSNNPTGVIALPTGKTPLTFIKWLKTYKATQAQKTIRGELSRYGIVQGKFPSTSNLRFVQLDEYYPIDPFNKNSFARYVKQHYLDVLELRAENVLSIHTHNLGSLANHSVLDIFPNRQVDITLRNKQAKTNLEQQQKEAIQRADEFCHNYEGKIRNWGGLGFFLGGIGPDGHIAFNIKNSPYDSTTRLLNLNEESLNAATSNFDGSGNTIKTAITIGLQTITHNPNVTAIIIASGANKALPVANAINNNPSPSYPAAIIQSLQHGRFNVDSAAAQAL